MPRCSCLVHFLTLSSSGASGNKLHKCVIQLSSLCSHHLRSYLEPSTNRSQAPWAGLVCVNENTPSPLAVTSSSWSFWHHDSPSRFSVYISVAPLAIFDAILFQMFSGFLEYRKTKTTRGQLWMSHGSSSLEVLDSTPVLPEVKKITNPSTEILIHLTLCSIIMIRKIPIQG